MRDMLNFKIFYVAYENLILTRNKEKHPSIFHVSKIEFIVLLFFYIYPHLWHVSGHIRLIYDEDHYGYRIIF